MALHEVERILRMSMEGLSIGLIAKLVQMNSSDIHRILEDAWVRGAQESVACTPSKAKRRRVELPGQK